MDKKIDEKLLFEALKPANEPEPELNRRILDRRLERNMRKLNFKKAAVAAAIGILVTAGGVSTYAASQDFSLLSLFQGESKEVRESAEKLLDTKVEQVQGTGTEQSQWAKFTIREAIVDKNQVKVQVEARATEADKYLLVPEGIGADMSVENLGMDGLKGEQTIAEYAESLGKKCMIVGADIDTKVQSAYCKMQEDGTLLFFIEYPNDVKSSKLDYVCNTSVCPPEAEQVDKNLLKDKITFTLKDGTDSRQVQYLPVKKGKVPGTNLVIDEVTFDKSELEMICNVKYHYAGKSEDWTNTKDYDICFYLLDSAGKIMKSGDGGSNSEEGKTVTQSWEYSLSELPDTITFQAKNVMDKTLYGTFEAKLVK